MDHFLVVVQKFLRKISSFTTSNKGSSFFRSLRWWLGGLDGHDGLGNGHNFLHPFVLERSNFQTMPQDQSVHFLLYTLKSSMEYSATCQITLNFWESRDVHQCVHQCASSEQINRDGYALERSRWLPPLLTCQRNLSFPFAKSTISCWVLAPLNQIIDLPPIFCLIFPYYTLICCYPLVVQHQWIIDHVWTVSGITVMSMERVEQVLEYVALRCPCWWSSKRSCRCQYRPTKICWRGSCGSNCKGRSKEPSFPEHDHGFGRNDSVEYWMPDGHVAAIQMVHLRMECHRDCVHCQSVVVGKLK